MTPQGVIEKIKDRVSGSKVYISVDIDVLDPAYAPGEFKKSVHAELRADYGQLPGLPKSEAGLHESF